MWSGARKERGVGIEFWKVGLAPEAPRMGVEPVIRPMGSTRMWLGLLLLCLGVNRQWLGCGNYQLRWLWA